MKCKNDSGWVGPVRLARRPCQWLGPVRLVSLGEPKVVVDKKTA